MTPYFGPECGPIFWPSMRAFILAQYAGLRGFKGFTPYGGLRGLPLIFPKIAKN
jgi:hypothetical protein